MEQAYISTRRALLWVVVAALAARVAAALLLGTTFRFVDEATYADAAVRLRSGAGLGAGYDNVPAYPALLALLGMPVAGGVMLVRVGQAALASLGCVLCFGLARRLGGDRAGLAAAAIYAVDPLVVVSAALLYPEGTAAVMLTAVLLTAWDGVRRDGLVSLAAAGFLLGVLALLRPVALVLAPVMLAWVALAPGASWRRRAAYALCLGVAWAAALLPWTYRNYRVHGRLTPIATAGTAGVLAGAESERHDVPGALTRAVQRDPVGFAARTAREFAGFWELYPGRLITDDSTRRAELSRREPRLSSAPVVPRLPRNAASALAFGLELVLAAIGLRVGWRTRRRETVWLVAMVLAFSLGYALFYGKLRYRIPVLPIVFAFAGLGGQAVLSRIKRPDSTDQSPPSASPGGLPPGR
jgi:4-amino-4-deoxy-L-arabinose transferase-like glycosyltransferase